MTLNVRDLNRHCRYPEFVNWMYTVTVYIYELPYNTYSLTKSGNDCVYSDFSYLMSFQDRLMKITLYIPVFSGSYRNG